MKQDAVTVYANGKIEFWFTDGELFWGHAIKVEGDLADGPKKAKIEG